jgi:hypothetical protein
MDTTNINTPASTVTMIREPFFENMAIPYPPDDSGETERSGS